MSPILNLQRRLMELGRLRMGAKGDKGEPRKLANWRLTSASPVLLESAAQVYGGSVQAWDGAPDEGTFELYTDTPVLDILIPPVFSQADGTPTAPYSQWLESWSGGGVLRRCDGETETISGQPCLCAAEGREPGDVSDKDACKYKTRLSVILPRVAGVGVWTLTTQGVNAAIILPGTLDLLVRSAHEGEFIEAQLRIAQRSRKTGGVTHRFVVPEIDIPGVKLGELPGVTGHSVNAPMPEPVRPALPVASPDPSTEAHENDVPPEWGNSISVAADEQPVLLSGAPNLPVQEANELATRLLFALGTINPEQSAMDDAIRRLDEHKASHTIEEHVTYLKRQVTRAENKLAEKDDS